MADRSPGYGNPLDRSTGRWVFLLVHSFSRTAMQPDQLFHRYQELQQYVGWTEADAHRVRSTAALLDSHLPALVDDFYAEIDRHPDARKVITGGTAQVARLKGTLLVWLRELL